MPLNLTLISSVYGIVSVIGLIPLAGARGREWTVPVWTFLALPCLVCSAASLPALLGFGFIGHAAHQPAVGGFAGLEALVFVIGLVFFDIIAVIVALMAPPPQAWTSRSATGGFIAAVVSATWCLVMSTLDSDAVAWTSHDTGTILIVSLVAWLVGMLVGCVFSAWKFFGRIRQNQAMEQNRDRVLRS